MQKLYKNVEMIYILKQKYTSKVSYKQREYYYIRDLDHSVWGWLEGVVSLYFLCRIKIVDFFVVVVNNFDIRFWL